MKYKNYLIILLFVVFFTLFGGREVEGQTAGFKTAEEALTHALSDYTEFVDEMGLWEVGQIFEEETYAYTIAKHQGFSEEERGYLLILTRQGEDGQWYTRTPVIDSVETYNQWLAEFPNSILSEYDKSYFYIYTETESPTLNSKSTSKYRFPWPILQTARLTQKGGMYHENQLDFVMRNSNSVYASKPGEVIFKKESSNTGGCDIGLWQYANLVVVKHSDTEFSWYFHLAKDSVTVEVGDVIGYGTKIGEQGNTGFACGTTGIHLHLMVSTSAPTLWPNPENDAVAPWPPGGSIVKFDFFESTWANLVEDSIYQSLNAPAPGKCAAGVSGVSIYDGTYCSSLLGQFTSPDFYELDTTGYQSKIESIEIPDGWSVNLYREKNELGPKVCLNQTDEMLWDNFLDDDSSVAANRAIWMRVFSTPNCQLDFSMGVKLYSSTDFSGEPAWGMVGTRATDGPSAVVQSVAIPDGYSLVIWDEDGYTGSELCLGASATELGNLGWGSLPVESLNFVQGNICEEVDTIKPTVSVISPVEGGNVVWPRTNIIADGYDLWGIKFMYFFAWYDEGSGHDWHFLGADDDSSDGWQYPWNLTTLVNPVAAIWVYAEDFSENSESAFISTLTMKRNFNFGDGYESRNEGLEEYTQAEIESFLPSGPPDISEFLGAGKKDETSDDLAPMENESVEVETAPQLEELEMENTINQPDQPDPVQAAEVHLSSDGPSHTVQMRRWNLQ